MAVKVTGYLNAILLWMHLQQDSFAYVIVEKEQGTSSHILNIIN